ncbi:MAG: DUF58 domain-containing protein [Acidobacteria bacterium]|nr:DUF58 domain-containing protein [Acidobacteriota bacterium]
MPTRRGNAVLAAAAACYLGARVTGADSLYAVAAAGAVLPALAAILVRRGGRALGRRRRRPSGPATRVGVSRALSRARLFAGDPLRIELSAFNPTPVTTPPLLLEDRAPAGLGGPIRLSLPGMPSGSRERAVAERRPALRGRFRLGPLDGVVVDPFGLASIRRPLAPAVQIVVYPRIEALGARLPPAGTEGWGGASLSAPALSGEEFYAVREWADGDDLRRVHWPSVARTGRLMIRQNESRPSSRATIFVDTRDRLHHGAGSARSIEWTLSAAASVVWHLARAGFSLRLAVAGRPPMRAVAGSGGVEAMLEALAVARPARAASIAPDARELRRSPGSGGALIAILPPPGEEGRADLAALAALRASYAWCGAMVLHQASFAEISPRLRAQAEGRAAGAVRALRAAGWAVAVAGARTPLPQTWNDLLSVEGLRPSRPSRHS